LIGVIPFFSQLWVDLSHSVFSQLWVDLSFIFTKSLNFHRLYLPHGPKMPTRERKSKTAERKSKTVERKYKTASVQQAVDNLEPVGPTWVEDICRERDELLRLCAENRSEREEFQKIAALYCNERAEMILECNLLRESTRLQRMMIESEHTELEIERYRLMGERLSFERWSSHHGIFPRY
jgi:hypothetical protein